MLAGTPRIAIVHEWLTTLGGSELVLGQLLRLFPRADVFALVDHMAADDRSALGVGAVETSFLQRVPGVARHYRSLLPLFPAAVRSLDVSGYDLVISNSHAVAKGVRTHERQLHVCYCLSPMRYAWDLRDQYLREAGLDRGLRGAAARSILERLKRWDERNTVDVDAFSTLSHYIADRIARAYGRDATVVYPPVDTDFFTPDDSPRDDFYVTASRFVPYKRIDLIARAFARLPEKRLVIAGGGPERAKVCAAARANVELVGRVDRNRLRELLRRARAFIFAAEEDFGIAPVEAQACGTPVIAFGRGGATETIVPATGVFFREQSEEALVDAIRRFEARDPAIAAADCRLNAERFSEARFRDEMLAFIEREWARFSSRGLSSRRPAPARV